MAGYDSRQPTRSSFAFAPAQPVETRSTLDPGFRGGDVVGGDSQGGVVRGTPFTTPTGDDGIPEFLARMVEPYVQQKQSEAVVKGATDYIAGKSIKDIAKGDSGIASIFGPSGYHQGAAAFAATDTWAKTKTAIANDPDIEKMGPDQLGPYLADKYKSMMTGDPLTDQLLQHTIMQDHGPLVTALTQKHEAYVQREAMDGWSNSLDSNGDYLQQSMTGIDTSSPSGQTAASTALQNYTSNFASKPYGMTDEAFDNGRVRAAMAAVSKGNFYAFEAMKANGLDRIMNDQQSARMDTAYQAGSSRAFAQASSNPEINKRLATLDMQIRTGYFKSPAELVKPIAEVNDIAKRITGITSRQLISGDDLLTMQKSLNEGQFQAGLRVQSHQWELAKEQRDHEWEIQKKELEDAEKLRLTSTYANAGNVAAGLAVGTVDEKDANLVFGQAAQGGNFGLLAHNFTSGSYVNSFAASQMQAPISNSVGIGVTEGFRSAYKQWSALHQANPAAAVAYFGDHSANMEGYDRLIHGGDTEIAAYAQTFGKGPELGRVDLPEGIKQKDAVSAVQSVVKADDRRYLGLMGSRTPLSTSSQNMLTEWLLPKAGAYARKSGIAIDQAASKIQAASLASGEIERAGPFVWNNQKATTKLGHFLGLPDEAMDSLVTNVAGDKLVKAGFSQGTGADDYTTMRIQGADGKPALYIIGYKPDHSGHTDVLVTLDDLKAANRKEVQAATEAASRPPVESGWHPATP